MLKLALVGKNIAHSKSQEMYEGILNEKVDYRLLDFDSEVDITPIEAIFDEVIGLSITSPYKKHFLKDVKMTPEIQSLGAINCIFKDGADYRATNTDYLAVKEIISNRFFSKTIVILGDGVMASITTKVLDELGVKFKQFSRRSDGDLNGLNLSGKNQLIINTCSRSFEFNNHLSSDAIFWDYNYSYTPHINYFKNHNVDYIDGLEMLHLQAKHALKFWRILD